MLRADVAASSALAYRAPGLTHLSVDHPRWWQWPTVLSLDAPLVCVVWQVLLAHVAAAAPGWPRELVLGASVWLAYAADRWIEGWRLEPARIRTPRHLFYQRRRWTIAAVWGAVLVVDTGVAFATLTRPDLDRGALLTAAVLVYLFSHQITQRAGRWRAPKEFHVAALLTAGVAIFLIPSPRSGDLIVPLTLFALLCFANCALIARWERDVDRAHGQTSLALHSARGSGLIRGLPWAIAGLALLVMLRGTGPGRVAVVCAAASAVAMAGIDAAEGRTGWPAARVLADVALLTPIVALLWRA